MRDARAGGTEARRFANTGRSAGIALGVGVAGLALGALDGWRLGDWALFFRAYLLNYAFVLSLALGALFFVLLQHLTRAGWSVAVRRLAEFVAATLPVLAALFLPLLVPLLTGMVGVWKWSNAAVVADDHLLQLKQPYLNVPFFLVRCGVYFAVWCLLARYFFRQSVAQDTSGDPRLTLDMQWWSAPGMLLYGLTVSFFAFDALMSLNPHWFSTIFGVYFFSGCIVGFFALLALLMHLLQRAGALQRSITTEHYHDVGKLAFGFVVFWAYIAFSQYMLIWYANLPEETSFYWPRQDNPWWAGVSLLLLFGHFFGPFLALISRYPKRRPVALALAAIWLLLMHWVELYWLVRPATPLAKTLPPPLTIADVALLAGIGGIFAWALLGTMGRHALLPERDPRLAESLAFQNV